MVHNNVEHLVGVGQVTWVRYGALVIHLDPLLELGGVGAVLLPGLGAFFPIQSRIVAPARNGLGGKVGGVGSGGLGG